MSRCRFRCEDGFERSGAARVGYGERNVDQKPIIGSQEFERRHQPGRRSDRRIRSREPLTFALKPRQSLPAGPHLMGPVWRKLSPDA